MKEIQCFEGDGVKHRCEVIHIEVEHYAFTEQRIAGGRKRAHIVIKLFNEHDVDILRDAEHEPLKTLELRYLKDDRSISATFTDITVSRIKKLFNGWNVRVHYSKVEDRNVYHG